jgi:hypothetical protein
MAYRMAFSEAVCLRCFDLKRVVLYGLIDVEKESEAR